MPFVSSAGILSFAQAQAGCKLQLYKNLLSGFMQALTGTGHRLI